MKILVHFKKQELEKFVAKLIDLNKQYNQKDYELPQNLLSLFEEVESYFKQIGDSTNESSLSQLSSYIHTALNGYDPRTLEKLKTGKRSLVNISCFHGLSELKIILNDALGDVIGTLDRNQETLKQFILSALQAKLMDYETIEKTKSLDEIEALWTQLKDNEQIKLIDTKLKMELLSQDIHLLLDQIFTTIQP